MTHLSMLKSKGLNIIEFYKSKIGPTIVYGTTPTGAGLIFLRSLEEGVLIYEGLRCLSSFAKTILNQPKLT